MDTRPKAQALDALTQMRKLLDSPESLDGSRRVILRGLTEYTEEQVTAITEQTRPRRRKETTT